MLLDKCVIVTVLIVRLSGGNWRRDNCPTSSDRARPRNIDLKTSPLQSEPTQCHNSGLSARPEAPMLNVTTQFNSLGWTAGAQHMLY